VATHLGLFDEVLATENGENLKGRSKLAAICRASSDDEFVYAGDSVADRPIWEAASASILVNAPSIDVKKARRDQKAEKVFSSRTPAWRAFIEEMRPLQYFKNILVFVPLLTSHEYTDSAMLLASVMAFICFCLCASGVYFINDLLDLSADRVHPTKKNRPLAAGDLPIHFGLMGGLGLSVFSFALAVAFLPGVFVLVLGLYFVITNAYSFYMKSRSTADVLTLAVLYTSRIFAGAAALGIWPSFWLIAFSIFVFVSLAYLKRYVEVAGTPHASENVPGRGYSFDDAETMFSLGVANITASVLILALYINSEEVVGLYQNSKILWLLCLLMLFWGNRIWVGARRGKIDDDPIVFAVKDRTSQLVGAGFVLVVMAARYLE
jgi:4-hydroxybenzoate polyprenyltransferase